MTDLIGIYSPYPQSGKSTLADAFLATDPNAVRIKFADAMRSVIVPFAAPFVDGGEDEIRAWLEDERKDTYLIPRLGVTLRHMLQMLGTEWGRKLIHPNLWVMIVEQRIKQARVDGKRIVVDDLRYENEYNALFALDAFLVRVERPQPPLTVHHDSNARLEDYYFDFIVGNLFGLDEWLSTSRATAAHFWGGHFNLTAYRSRRAGTYS
jgi:hypothetical protein